MIGKVINKLLKDSAALVALVGSKIYPLAIEQDDTLPGVLYRIISTTPEYDRDGCFQDIHEVEICIYALTYVNCLTVAKEVRTALDCKKGVISGVNVVQIRVTNLSESFEFDTNVYLKNIKFTIKTQ